MFHRTPLGIPYKTSPFSSIEHNLNMPIWMTNHVLFSSRLKWYIVKLLGQQLCGTSCSWPIIFANSKCLSISIQLFQSAKFPPHLDGFQSAESPNPHLQPLQPLRLQLILGFDDGQAIRPQGRTGHLRQGAVRDHHLCRGSLQWPMEKHWKKSCCLGKMIQK